MPPNSVDKFRSEQQTFAAVLTFPFGMPTSYIQVAALSTGYFASNPHSYQYGPWEADVNLSSWIQLGTIKYLD